MRKFNAEAAFQGRRASCRRYTLNPQLTQADRKGPEDRAFFVLADVTANRWLTKANVPGCCELVDVAAVDQRGGATRLRR
jgi:hypothetical protein